MVVVVTGKFNLLTGDGKRAPAKTVVGREGGGELHYSGKTRIT